MNYLTKELYSDIQNEFPDISFKYMETNFGGIIPAFFINIKDENTLKNQWKAFTEFIALHFQSSLRNEFSIWNLYLFFILEQEVEGDLKYIIENDTFSSRKIIICPNQEIESIIQEHIINDDMVIKTSEEEQDNIDLKNDYIVIKYFEERLRDQDNIKEHQNYPNENKNSLNEIIWNVLKDIELKKRISEDIKSGLDEIIQRIAKIEEDEV